MKNNICLIILSIICVFCFLAPQAMAQELYNGENGDYRICELCPPVDMSNIMDDDSRTIAGVAGSVATASLQFAPDHPGLQAAFGAGVYRSERGYALGLGSQVTKNIFLHANGAYTTTDDYTLGAGITFLFK